MSLDAYRDECGLFGIFNHPEAAKITYLGLYALQHRGQESCGIVSSDNRHLHSHKAMGLVADAFDESTLSRLTGNSSVGHVRYSTAGESMIKNAQPFIVEYSRGEIAIAHNGNLINARLLRDELEAYGSIFQSSMDTEIIIHLIASMRENSLVDRLAGALRRVKGAYSLLFLTESEMIAVRDPSGFRPLSLGRMKGSWVVASETCAFDLIGAEYVRDIEQGEMLFFNKDGLRSFKPFPKRGYTPCIFEFIYFARPDSRIFGSNVYMIRENLGRELAREYPVEADMVVPVPDSGLPAAVGYSMESGVPFRMGLMRNHYIGRTFIEPRDSIRHFGVKVKLNTVGDIFRGKRVVVVDDSIVRGTTSRKIIKMIRDAGAKEVHMRISSPPTVSPCFYGIDTPTKQELVASSHTIEEINRYITSDTLCYLTLDGLYKAVAGSGKEFCDACFTCNYPLSFPHEKGMPQLKLFK